MKCAFLYLTFIFWITKPTEAEDNAAINTGLIVEKLGLVTEKIGKLAITDSDTLISVIIKLPDIIKYMGNSENELYDLHICYDNGEINNSSLKTLNDLDSNWTKIANDYLESRRDVLKPYILGQQETVKRQALLMGGIALATLVFGGVSEYQIHEVNNHLKDNKQDITDLKKELDLYHNQMVILKNNLVGLVKADVDTLKNFIDSNSCKNAVEILQNRREFNFKRISEVIDNVLSGAIEGRGELTLTPKILKPETLKLIVSQHASLNNTIFYNDPYLLYSLVKINLVSIDKSFTNAHFVMRVPIIRSLAKVFNLYSTKQVGTFVKNNTCRYVRLPTYLLENDKVFYAVNLDKCTKHNKLHVCPTFSLLNTSACLQRDGITCPIQLTSCKSRCEIKTTNFGFIFRDQPNNNQSYIFDKNGWIQNLKLRETRAKFVSWHNISAAQICDTKLETPNSNFPAIPIFNMPINYAALEIMDPQEISKVISDLTAKYNTTLNEALEPVFSFNDDWGHKDIITGINSLLIIVIIIFMICIHCNININCSACKCTKSCCNKQIKTPDLEIVKKNVKQPEEPEPNQDQTTPHESNYAGVHDRSNSS